jgi:hypothetical protein
LATAIFQSLSPHGIRERALLFGNIAVGTKANFFLEQQPPREGWTGFRARDPICPSGSLKRRKFINPYSMAQYDTLLKRYEFMQFSRTAITGNVRNRSSTNDNRS